MRSLIQYQGSVSVWIEVRPRDRQTYMTQSIPLCAGLCVHLICIIEREIWNQCLDIVLEYIPVKNSRDVEWETSTDKCVIDVL
jgi:hypothetical protein